MKTGRILIPCLLLIAAALAAAPPAAAGDAGWPELGEKIKSMGFHSKYKPYFGAMLKWDRCQETTRGGGEVMLGVYRGIGHPDMGIGLMGGKYAAAVEDEVDGGLRGFFSIKTFLLAFGADYSLRDDRVMYIWSIQVPVWRKGPIQRGGDCRLDFVLGKRRSYNFGIMTPLRQPYAAKTRPRLAHVALPPKPGRTFEKPYEAAAGLDSVPADISRAAKAISFFTAPFLDRKRGSDEDDIRRFRAKLVDFRKRYYATDGDFPAGHTFEAEIRFHHRSLVRAFSLAAGDEAAGAALAAKAREILFEEVVLPYNRLLGQWKANDSSLGYGARAVCRDGSTVRPVRVDAPRRDRRRGGRDRTRARA